MTEAARVAMERLVDAVNRADDDELVALTSSDVQILAARSALEGAYTGRAGVRRWVEGLRDQVAGYELVIEDLRPAGAERVLVLGRQRGTMRATDTPIDWPLAAICQFEAGALTRMTVHPSAEDAVLAL